jgi:hypothetical protein
MNISFHSDLARKLSDEAGFIFDDLIIWDRRHEYNNMQPLGYIRTSSESTKRTSTF